MSQEVAPTCKLCGEQRELLVSHVIPRFMMEWLKRTSPTPFLRSTTNPNKRLQDGPKQPLFCGECEQRLGALEKVFAETVFVPLNKDAAAIIHYDGALIRFCASISLRVLLYYEQVGQSHLTDTQQRRRDQAMLTWRRLLLGEIDNPGGFEQHLLPFDVVASADTGRLPPNFNRYLTRAMHIDVVAGSHFALTYAKLGKVCILGIIEQPEKRVFHGSRVGLRAGTIRPRRYGAPAELADFMIAKAREERDSRGEMSTNQKAKVQRLVESDLDRLAQSDFFRAFSADVALFGKKAFEQDPREE